MAPQVPQHARKRWRQASSRQSESAISCRLHSCTAAFKYQMPVGWQSESLGCCSRTESQSDAADSARRCVRIFRQLKGPCWPSSTLHDGPRAEDRRCFFDLNILRQRASVSGRHGRCVEIMRVRDCRRAFCKRWNFRTFCMSARNANRCNWKASF